MTYNIFPKGALTHHSPLASGGIPPVGRAVRSPRGMRRLRTPFSQYRCARLAGQLASASGQGAWLHHAGAQAHLTEETRDDRENGGDTQ